MNIDNIFDSSLVFYIVINACLLSISFIYKKKYFKKASSVQGCGIAMPDSSDSYIEPAEQVDFPG